LRNGRDVVALIPPYMARSAPIDNSSLSAVKIIQRFGPAAMFSPWNKDESPAVYDEKQGPEPTMLP
jgi:hypothetical protein